MLNSHGYSLHIAIDNPTCQKQYSRFNLLYSSLESFKTQILWILMREELYKLTKTTIQ